jgi:hypothetical protein
METIATGTSYIADIVTSSSAQLIETSQQMSDQALSFASSSSAGFLESSQKLLDGASRPQGDIFEMGAKAAELIENVGKSAFGLIDLDTREGEKDASPVDVVRVEKTFAYYFEVQLGAGHLLALQELSKVFDGLCEEKQKGIGLIRWAYLSPYVDRVNQMYSEANIDEDAEETESEEKYLESLKTFSQDLGPLQTDPRIVHQIQLMDTHFLNMVERIHHEKDHFMNERKEAKSGSSVVPFTSEYLAKICDIYLKNIAEFDSLVVETLLVIANLLGSEEFSQLYRTFITERRPSKEANEKNDDDESDDESDDDETRKYIISQSFSLSSIIFQFFHFQVTRLSFMTKSHLRALENVVHEGKCLVQAESENTDQSFDALSAHARSVFCRFSIDTDDSKSELLGALPLLKPIIVYFLLSSIGSA